VPEIRDGERPAEEFEVLLNALTQDVHIASMALRFGGACR